MCDSVPRDIPTKHCSKCNRDLPATGDFFVKDKKRKDGLYLYCNECRHAEYRAKHPPKKTDLPLEEGYKRCSKCKQVFPATNEFFYNNRHRKDRLHPYCKTCRHDEVQEKVAENPNYWKEKSERYRPKTIEEQEKLRIRGARNMQAFRARKKQPGLCTGCLIRPVEPGHLCDVCAAYQKQYREQEANRNKQRIAQKRLRDQLREQVLAAYGNACTCCGETCPEFLAVDHVNNDGAEHRRTIRRYGGSSFYRWLRKNNFPKDGFQLLCNNCNQAKAVYGVCPHQSTTP